MDEYLQRRETQLRDMTVQCRNAAGLSRCRYFWTKRTTNSDVMSVITTVNLFYDSTNSAEKMPQSQNIEKYANPLEKIRDFNKEERKRINLALWKERETFMEKLRSQRHSRARLEAKAAVVVQAAYRRYSVLRYWLTRKQMLTRRKNIRERIWRSLGGADKTKWIIKQAMNTERLKSEAAKARRKAEEEAREHAAKERAEKEKAEREALELERGAIAIQNAQRAKVAQEIVARKRQQFEELNRQKMAVRIQGVWRCFLARIRVSVRRSRLHYIASVIIESMCRVGMAKKKTAGRRSGETSEESERRQSTASKYRIKKRGKR